MKIFVNKVLVLFSVLAIVNVMHAVSDLIEWKMDRLSSQMGDAMSEHAREQQKEKNLEIEALLLIDSAKVITDYVKDREFLKLKTVYDKMNSDSIYVRPTKGQIEEWHAMIQEQISQVKIDNKISEESRVYLKQNIKNGIMLCASCVCSGLLNIWGCEKIHNNPDGSNYLAKYAIDAGILIGFPLNSFLLLKLIVQLVSLQLISHDEIETLRKMDSLLMLFEQLNEDKS